MVRLFLKGFLTLFLWIILLVNLAYTFNMVTSLGSTGISGVDYSDKYFGVSSMINAIKNMGTDMAWLDDVRGAYSSVFKFASFMISYTFGDYGIVNSETGEINIAFFVLRAITALPTMIAALGVYIIGAIIFVAYLFLFVGGLTAVLLKFIAGGYYQSVPHSGLLDSLSYGYNPPLLLRFWG